MSDHYLHHDSASPAFPPGTEGYKQFVGYYLAAFPDVRYTIHDEVQEGDTAVTRWSVAATHRGDLPGLPASGKTCSVTGMTMARAHQGKIIESWSNWDALGLMKQLGITEADSRAV
jgi:steroid delta-isomerase-like uncharacterized protein